MIHRHLVPMFDIRNEDDGTIDHLAQHELEMVLRWRPPGREKVLDPAASKKARERDGGWVNPPAVRTLHELAQGGRVSYERLQGLLAYCLEAIDYYRDADRLLDSERTPDEEVTLIGLSVAEFQRILDERNAEATHDFRRLVRDLREAGVREPEDSPSEGSSPEADVPM